MPQCLQSVCLNWLNHFRALSVLRRLGAVPAISTGNGDGSIDLLPSVSASLAAFISDDMDSGNRGEQVLAGRYIASPLSLPPSIPIKIGSWCLVDGHWYLVFGKNGQIIIGIWYLVIVNWYLVFGVWYLMFGNWPVVCGAW